jgi:hypothetical protein
MADVSFGPNMTTQEIEKYIEALNDELSLMGVKGEICLYGGAVMCLVYQARPSTKDVDAVFQPSTQMREAPEWILTVPAPRDPWFVSGMESLKAIAIVESPLPFRIRKIFVLENFLSRV